jgi:hypothetical protein
MTTIRAKLAAIVLALATGGGLAALSPAGPAVADTSQPKCDYPNKLWVIVYPNRTEYLCLPPDCTPIVCQKNSSQGALLDRQNGLDRRLDRQVIGTGQHATPLTASGQEPNGQAWIPMTAAST